MLARPPQPAPLQEERVARAGPPWSLLSVQAGPPPPTSRPRRFRSCLGSAPPRLATGPGPALQAGLVLLE